jgi:glycosyltransferase involved in cell wall biosynthesis
MKVAFIDTSDLKYQLEDLERAPLGGSQSAMILVAAELARAGATVSVLGMHLEHGTAYRGVTGLSLDQVEKNPLGALDAVVSVNFLPQPKDLKRLLGRAHRPRVIHWHKNDALALYAAKFADPAFHAHVDHFVFGSHFQANSFIGLYGLPCTASSVIANPLAAPYFGLFAENEPVLAAKDPELLIYASAPNRGMEGLLTIVFPELRRARPALRLEIYSGFYLDQGQAYAFKGENTTARYQQIVREAGATPGVSCHPGLPKRELAQRFRRAAMLCYPTIFRETSCHVALEAMAAGCLVSSTTVGALQETTAGYATLTPATHESIDPPAFSRNTLKALEERDRDPAGTEQRLRRQIAHVQRCHTSAAIGRRWGEFLETEVKRGRA